MRVKKGAVHSLSRTRTSLVLCTRTLYLLYIVVLPCTSIGLSVYGDVYSYTRTGTGMCTKNLQREQTQAIYPTKTPLSLEDDSFMGKPLRNTLKTLSAGPTPRGAQEKSMCVGDGYIDVLAGTRNWSTCIMVHITTCFGQSIMMLCRGAESMFS